MQTTPFTASRVSGVLLAVLGGLAATFVSDWLTRTVRLYQDPNSVTYSLTFTALCILVAGVGAWFLRTWWALLWVPVAFFVGYMVGGFIDMFMPGNAFDIGYLMLGAAIFIFYLLPLVLVSLIATLISKRMAKRDG